MKAANLYPLREHTIVGKVAVFTPSYSSSEMTQIWHMRLGHMKEAGLHEFSKRGVIVSLSGDLDFCEHCVFAKHKRVEFASAAAL